MLWYILGINFHFPNSLLGDKWIFIVMYENMSENTNITGSDIAREQRQLLDWCIQRGCIWEWNRQYARYLLHEIDVFKIPENPVSNTQHIIPAIGEYRNDWRWEQYKNGYKILTRLKDEGKIQQSYLEIQIICWACLSEKEINNPASLVQSMKEYEERIMAAAYNPEYLSQFSTSSRGAYLCQIELTESNLNHILLARANLNLARLSTVKMFHANLEYAKCSAIQISKADLREANLSNSYFLSCCITDSCLDQVTADYADFSYAKITGCSICGGEECDAYVKNFARIEGIGCETFKTSFEKVNFSQAKFVDVRFAGTYLSDSIFTHSVLKNVDFTSTVLNGCNFQYSDADSATLLTWNQEGLIRISDMVDEDTDFTGVALSAIRINPELKTALEKNIRKKYWNDWYATHKTVAPIVRLFWNISDYGTTSIRAIYAFIGLNFMAFATYLIIKWDRIFASQNIGEIIPRLLELLGNTFLTMFGLGNIGITGWYVLFTAVHVILGYFILAILVTRFAIMFQSLTG